MSQSKPDRRIDRLKIQASEMGLAKDRVREFGHLTKTETWEKAIAFSQATTPELDRWREIEPVDNVIHSSAEIRQHQQNFLAWIDLPQLIALLLVAVGFFVLIAPALRKIPNPLPVRINIQIGASK